MMAFLSDEVTLQSCNARSFTDTDILERFAPQDEPGVVASESIPNQNVAEIQWHVDRVMGQRLVRGKTYLSGLTELDTDSGFLSNGLLGEIDAFSQQLLDFHPLDDDDMNLVMFSPRDGNWQVIKSSTVLDEYRMLRRRRTSS